MSQPGSKRRKTHEGVSGEEAAAAASSAAQSARPAAPAASSSTVSSLSRLVVGRRAQPATNGAPAPVPGGADEPIQIDGEAEVDEDAWTYGEPSDYLNKLGEKYKFRLEPTTAPVFSKYKQAGLDAIVGEIMKFILLKTSAGEVTTHKDILTLLQDRCKSGANAILSDARRRFMELYGYELHEITKVDTLDSSKKRKSSSSSSAATSGGTKSYILRIPAFRSTGLRKSFNVALSLKGDQHHEEAKRGLLFLLYAIIHAEESGQSNEMSMTETVKGLEEKKMWKILERLKLDENMKYHSIFGNVSALIDEFVRHQYLTKTKLPGDINADGGGGGTKHDSFAYRIGQRGLAETTNTLVYTGMCKHMFHTETNQAHLNQIARNEALAKGQKPPQAATAQPQMNGPAPAAASQR